MGRTHRPKVKIRDMICVIEYLVPQIFYLREIVAISHLGWGDVYKL